MVKWFNHFYDTILIVWVFLVYLFQDVSLYFCWFYIFLNWFYKLFYMRKMYLYRIELSVILSFQNPTKCTVSKLLFNPIFMTNFLSSLESIMWCLPSFLSGSRSDYSNRSAFWLITGRRIWWAWVWTWWWTRPWAWWVTWIFFSRYFSFYDSNVLIVSIKVISGSRTMWSTVISAIWFLILFPIHIIMIFFIMTFMIIFIPIMAYTVITWIIPVSRLGKITFCWMISA